MDVKYIQILFIVYNLYNITCIRRWSWCCYCCSSIIYI